MRIAYLFLAGVSLFGQSLRLSPVTGPAGEARWLDIALKSPSGKEPVALQWELTFPADRISADPGGPVAGPAAEAASKFLRCSGRSEKAPQTYRYRCLVVGPPKPIGNGIIARLHFSLPPGAKAGTTRIRIEQIEALTTDSKLVRLKPAKGIVKVSR